VRNLSQITKDETMKFNRLTLLIPATLLTCLILLAGSLAQAMTISASEDALGISWTLSATDSVGADYAADYEVMFSVQANLPSDLSLIMDDDGTISPQWITTSEARIAGLEDFMLVSAPGGTDGWYDYTGPSANSCSNNINFASACAEAISDSGAAEITSDATYTWTWVGNVSDLDAVFADDYSGLQHIGAHLESDGHPNGWNVSISNPIPEPSAALVFGVGIAFAATRVRRDDGIS
jgi:hypothetical protein